MGDQGTGVTSPSPGLEGVGNGAQGAGLCVPGGAPPEPGRHPDASTTPGNAPPPLRHPPGNTVVYLRHAASLSCKTPCIPGTQLRFLLLTAPDLPECGPTSQVSPPVTLRARAPDLPSCDFRALPPETPISDAPRGLPSALPPPASRPPSGSLCSQQAPSPALGEPRESGEPQPLWSVTGWGQLSKGRARGDSAAVCLTLGTRRQRHPSVPRPLHPSAVHLLFIPFTGPPAAPPS